MATSAAPTATVTPEQRPDALTLVAEERASTLLVRVDGDVDLASIPQLAAALDQIDLSSITLLVVDLDEVGFLDLAGLNAILRLNDDCERSGVHLSVIEPRGSAKRVFTLTRADLALDLVDAAVSSGR